MVSLKTLRTKKIQSCMSLWD